MSRTSGLVFGTEREGTFEGDADKIVALNANRQALKKKGNLTLVATDRGDATTYF